MKQLPGKWIKIALFNFLIAALIGLSLRFAFVFEIKWLSYKSFQDAHSNMALLGWIFQGIFACFAACFLPDSDALKRKYNRIFTFNQILISIITLSFLLAINRIISNTFLLILSASTLYYTISFIKDARGSAAKMPCSYRLAVISLFFLLASFLGLYAITPVLFLATAKKVLFYYLGVQFFLHFQYNGWFTFAIAALLFRHAENNGIVINQAKGIRFAILMSAGTILNYFLSIYWGYRSHQSYLWISSAGTVIQIIAIMLTFDHLKKIWDQLMNVTGSHIKLLLWLTVLCFAMKLFMQLITMVPEIASLAFTIRNYVIAYLHLIFLGVMSFFILAWVFHKKLLHASQFAKAGVYALITGFILMEILLFIQGTMLWTGLGFMSSYYEFIFTISIFLPLGLMLIIVRPPQTAYN